MHRLKWLLIGLLSLATPSLAGGGTYVLGDSIGDGVATTLGMNNLAQIGIHIRGPKALAQIARTPIGSTVYIFLGTNDAEGSLTNIDKSIDDILDAAARRQLSVIWVGPHCVRKAWDAQARALDDILRTHLAKTSAKYTSVKYIGMRDAGICSGNFHEPDGVHLTMKGYRYMWAMVEKGTGAPATAVASAPPQPGGGGSGAELTTASIMSRPPQPSRLADASAGHRLVMEFHVPGSPSEPLQWTRSQN
jgi:lysophospholipase L1-like esterase